MKNIITKIFLFCLTFILGFIIAFSIYGIVQFYTRNERQQMVIQLAEKDLAIEALRRSSELVPLLEQFPCLRQELIIMGEMLKQKKESQSQK